MQFEPSYSLLAVLQRLPDKKFYVLIVSTLKRLYTSVGLQDI